MSFFLNRIRIILGGSAEGIADAPADQVTYGRFDGEWEDTFRVIPVNHSAFDFKDSFWDTHTGNYHAQQVVAAALSNVPFPLKTAHLYDFIIESIAGPDCAVQNLTATSTLWKGQRCYCRSAQTLGGITAEGWKNINMAFVQDAVATTTTTMFETVLTHVLEDDTTEQILFTSYGERSAIAGKGYFEVSATVENVGGIVNVVGSTVVIAHSPASSVKAQVVADGANGVLLQTKTPSGIWNWRSQANFNDLEI